MGTSENTLEVFSYVIPAWLIAFIGAAAVVTVTGAAIFLDDDLRRWLGERAIPLGVALVVLGLAMSAATRLYLVARFKRLDKVPALVADRQGLRTKYYGRIPWSEVIGFGVARLVFRGSEMYRCACVLVRDTAQYRRPWWHSRLWSTWEPSNALPVAWPTQHGYSVRHADRPPLLVADEEALVSELQELGAGA